jgi:hypothetical protein
MGNQWHEEVSKILGDIEDFWLTGWEMDYKWCIL